MKEQETQNNNINTKLPDYEDFTEYDEDYDGDGEIDSYEEVSPDYSDAEGKISGELNNSVHNSAKSFSAEASRKAHETAIGVPEKMAAEEAIDYFEEEDDLAYAPAPVEKSKSDLFNFLHRKDKKSEPTEVIRIDEPNARQREEIIASGLTEDEVAWRTILQPSERSPRRSRNNDGADQECSLPRHRDLQYSDRYHSGAEGQEPDRPAERHHNDQSNGPSGRNKK